MPGSLSVTYDAAASDNVTERIISSSFLWTVKLHVEEASLQQISGIPSGLWSDGRLHRHMILPERYQSSAAGNSVSG